MTARVKQTAAPKPSPVDDLFAPAKGVPPQANILGSPFVPPTSQQLQPIQPVPQSREAEQTAVIQQQPQEDDGPVISKTMAVAICILIIVAAIIGLIIYFILNRAPPKPAPKPAPKKQLKNQSSEDDDEEGEEEDADEESIEDRRKRQQETARLELQKTHVELERYRKNDAMLKSQLNHYAQRIRKLEAEKEDLRKAADTKNLLDNFRQQQGMPSENGFIDVPDKPKEGPKSDEEKTTKERRQELMNMVNKPRKTVADIQQEEADLKEASEQANEELDRKAIDDETNAKIFVVNDEDVDDDRLIASVNTGK